MDKNLTFAGAWTEVTSKRDIQWYFPPDGRGWKHDRDDRTLRIHHINQRDDLYSVRRLTEESALLTDIIDHRVTMLQR